MKRKGVLRDNLKTMVVLLLSICIFSGCSTIGVYSDPSGAKIFINEKETRMVTPKIIGARNLRTGRSYITVEKEGYETLTKRQAVDVRVSIGNILMSWWPPVLFKNLFGNLWKGITYPRNRHLKEFELEKNTVQKEKTIAADIEG